MEYVIADSAPLCVSEGEGFKRMIAAIDPQLRCPGRKMVTSMIGKRFDSVSLKTSAAAEVVSQSFKTFNHFIWSLQIMGDIRKIVDLIPAKGISVIADLWSSRRHESILGLAMQFISDWEVHNITCGFREFEDFHTGKNIKLTLDDFCYKKLLMKPEQVRNFRTRSEAYF